jgi:hypothetical protein
MISVRQSNRQNVRTETKWSRSSTAQTGDVCGRVYRQSDSKGKTSHVTDTDVLLPDKLNTFFTCFEDNSVPRIWASPENCELTFTVADVSKTFKRVNPHKAAGPDGIPSRVLKSMRRPDGWSVYGHIQSIHIPVCCPHMLQDVHHYSCTQESKGN